MRRKLLPAVAVLIAFWFVPAPWFAPFPNLPRWTLPPTFGLTQRDLQPNDRRSSDENADLIQKMCFALVRCPCVIENAYQRTSRLERVIFLYPDLRSRSSVRREALALGLSEEDLVRAARSADETFALIQTQCASSTRER